MKNKPIKVLVISSYDDNWNAVRPEGEMLIGLHQAGLEVTVMTQGHAPYAERFRQAGLRVIDFHPKRKFDRDAVAFIREELLENAYDILHLYNNKAIINGVRAASGLPVKVLTYRGYTGNIHWFDPTNYLTHLHPRVDKITCVSGAVKEVFDRQLFFDSNKAVVVSKGHDPSWYEGIEAADVSEFGFPEKAVVVSVVANARRMKGIPFLVEATHYLPTAMPVYFLLIGRGLDSPKIQALLKKSPYGEHFRFAGFRKDVLSLVKGCDLSVLPSIKGEGLSKVLLEALFLGKATIMTDIGGNRGLAVDGESGLVVPSGDAKALAAAIEKLTIDAKLRKQMGQAGAAYVAEHFSVARSVKELKLVYESLI
ncbi:MAG: glycosyl transferase [Saprospiraceae bacterium]|nr:MAG: glycosyl transferase [Saprospiraceae bacterium]